MSSNRQWNVIVLLIIASLIGIVILFVRKAVMFSCMQTDQTICRFLENYKNMSERPMQGMYTVTNQNDDSTYTITWQKHKDSRLISATQEGKPILEAVILKESVYLKDYSDNKWWKQSVSDTTFNESYLPFDPYRYFIELDPILFDPQTNYTVIGETKCSDKNCLRYQVTSPKQSKDLQRFIYVTSDNELYIVVDVDSSSSHETKMAASNESIYEPKEIKVPSKDQNIFLDYLSQQEKERQKQLEYLKEFQSQREKAEVLQDDPIKYVEESETSTPSAN